MGLSCIVYRAKHSYDFITKKQEDKALFYGNNRELFWRLSTGKRQNYGINQFSWIYARKRLTKAPLFTENAVAFLYGMKASVRHIHISPKKAALVADLVRGKKTDEALDFLKLADKKAAGIIYKVVASAVANAQNNEGKSKDNLEVAKIYVTKARKVRRGIPGSRGRVDPIVKRSSHIFVELGEMVIAEAEPTKPKAAKKTAAAKKTPQKTA